MGDFNVTMGEKYMIDFCELNVISSLIDKPTCYEHFDKATYIKLILTNKLSYFQHSNVFETRFPNFHLLTVQNPK